MLVIFYLLLLLRDRCLTSGYNFVVTTVRAGQNVTLTCPRSPSNQSGSLFWIKFSSVNWPEFLGQTITYDYDKVTKTRHLTSKQEKGTFILHFKETQQNDTGLYYCIKIEELKMIFVNGTFLKINGPEAEVPAVTQVPLPDSLHPGDAVTLQCSVFFHCESKKCLTDHGVHWFKAGSDESHPSVIYVDWKSGKECKESHEAHTCVYNFSKIVSRSDAGTYYCAVATYEEIIFGNGAELKIQELTDLWMSTSTLFLCIAVASCLLVILYLVYIMKKKKTCNFCNDAITGRGAQQNEERNVHTLVYSAPTFTRSKLGKAERRKVKAHEETVYTSVSK